METTCARRYGKTEIMLKRVDELSSANRDVKFLVICTNQQSKVFGERFRDRPNVLIKAVEILPGDSHPVLDFHGEVFIDHFVYEKSYLYYRAFYQQEKSERLRLQRKLEQIKDIL